MLPQLVTVGWRRADGRRRRLFVPVVPVALVLSPLLLLAALGGVIACLIFRISSLGALAGLWRVVRALPGSRLELDDGHLAFQISIR
ncbi:hypothetical protein ACFYNO_27115 [Kitasatospora sp. NPDC006697]|uniref:hypothetical protein n=1 Tax=Kitasatospora sp. NPDC006697 TaxID=3364020 RepID=UPI0036830153